MIQVSTKYEYKWTWLLNLAFEISYSKYLVTIIFHVLLMSRYALYANVIVAGDALDQMKLLTVLEPEEHQFIGGPAMFGPRLGGESNYQVTDCHQ